MIRSDPFRQIVRWLAAHAQFPRSRLESRAEILLCLAAIAMADDETENQRFLVQSRDPSKDAALRAHTLRRSQAHYISDNKQKV